MQEIKKISHEELNNLLVRGDVEQVYVRKTLENGKYEVEITRTNKEHEQYSDWKIDVWDIHGVLKHAGWGLGCGSQPELPAGARWVNIGWFTVAVKENETLTPSEQESVSKCLMVIIERRSGAINMSGFYPVTDSELQELVKASGGKLYIP